MGVVPQHVAVDAVGAARRRRHVVVVLGEAAGDAVVDDGPGLIGHQGVAAAPHLLFLVGEGVHAVHELGGVRPPHLDAAQGRDVDEADVGAHRCRLLADAFLAALGRPVEGGAPPRPGHHHARPGFQVAVVHGGQAFRVEGAPGEHAEGLGQGRRAHRGGPHLGRRTAPRPRRQAHGGEPRLAPLARPHAGGRVALEEFQFLEAVGHRVRDVGDDQVLVEVHELLALGVREDGPRMVDADVAALIGELGLGAPVEAPGGGRRPPGVTPLGHHRVEIVGAVHRPRHAHARWYAVGAQCRRGLVVGQLGAGMAQQSRRRRISHRHADHVALDGERSAPACALAADLGDAHALDALLAQALEHGMPGDDAQAPAMRRRGHFRGRGLGAQVGDGGDLDAGVEQVERHPVAVVVGGGHHGAPARRHRVEAHQALRRRPQHDPRQVVVAEDHGLFEGAGGQHHRPRPHLVQAIAMDHGQPVVVVKGLGHGARVHPDAGMGFRRLHQLGARPTGALPGGVEARVVQRAARRRLVVEEHDLGARRRRLDGRRQAGRPAADHGDVAKQVHLVVVAVRRLDVDPAEPGDAAHHPLPQLPRPLRLVEGLVVEADRQEGRAAFDPGRAVVVQGARIVLAPDDQPLGGRHHVGQGVGLVGELDQGVAVLPGHGEDAAWAVVFEGARQRRHPGGGERAGHRVAGQGLDGASLEGEGVAARAVDEAAEGFGQALFSHGAKSTRSAKTSEAA